VRSHVSINGYFEIPLASVEPAYFLVQLMVFLRSLTEFHRDCKINKDEYYELEKVVIVSHCNLKSARHHTSH